MTLPKLRKKETFINKLSKYFPKMPDSIFSSQALETFKFDNTDFQTEKGKKLLYTTYRRYPLITQAITLRSALAIPSVHIKTTDKQTEKVIALFLAKLHPCPESRLLALRTLLRSLWVDAELFGTGFIDPQWNKKKTEYVSFKKIHPVSMDLLRTGEGGFSNSVQMDKKGNPKGWIQEINNKKKELSFKDITFLSFKNIGDEILGISLIESVYKTTWRLMNIEEGLATAIFRHGFPLYDITISGGIDGRPPTKEQLDDAAKQVGGLNYKSEFIHPPNYKVKLLEAFSLGKGEDYTDNFVSLICSATGLPRWFLLGTGKDISKAAPDMLKVIKPSLEENQTKLKLFFEEQILYPLMKANHITDCPELIIGEIPFSKTDDEIKTEKEKEKPKEEKPIEEKKDEETSPKEKEDLSQPVIPAKIKSKKLPELNLISPHAELISKGLKKQIIKSKKEMKELKKYIGKEIELVSDNKVYGIIQLREPHEINVNDFIQLRYAHAITDDERKEWYPKEKVLFSYEFDIVELYKKPKKLGENND
jgi:hypothetical protein